MAFALWRARALDVVPVLGGGAAHAKGPTAQLDDARAQAAQARAAQAAELRAQEGAASARGLASPAVASQGAVPS